ncbi:hypothetical protein Hypma_015698 [Hypsizygus marmoreus]|uniref:Heparinase II/III-like C-terminal domain-containing protein n=1 Tax=Hypsizygus marmoreus TaxID=39966 RepID=A0A369K5Q9_HYPMA|nr:hypothetical protein Hypma_015698 [Hypsizygus marmoreus]
MAPNYNSVDVHPSPYGSGDPYYNESSGFITPHPAKKRTSNWIKIGVPVLILVIVGAVVGGVLGSRSSKSDNKGTTAASSSSEAAASSAASVKLEIGRFATATNSAYMMPVYPSTTNTAAFTTPTFSTTANAALAWPKDPFQPKKPDILTVRPDRPRLIAPGYKWQALPALIRSDPYLQGWNDTIFGNATDFFGQQPVAYFKDGASGILDVARDIKRRIKAFAYVYHMTNDTKWVDRTFVEIQNAAGNGTTPFGTDDDDKWNVGHFLDAAELSAAFAIAYDWLYPLWSEEQKSQIRTSLIRYGLQPGLVASTTSAGWWRTNTTGNWNCVCNSGLTLASLAILDDDTTGIAKQLLGLTVPNALENCAVATADDGSWAETANYWYFGSTGHAEMSSALLTATGSAYGLLDVNKNFYKTGTFHMYVYGPTSLFDYGDHGPNKFSATANSLLLYGDYYNQPQFQLFQREQYDAAEPWSMFWYNPSVSGAFWDGAELDHFFDNSLDQWASMRSSWTDANALFVAIKAGKNQGHQTHNDLDAGDFVLDALGTRWAGELGSGDYLSPGYFSNDSQDSDRWKYYRKMTEGQNTILINQANQNVLAAPTVKHGSSGTTQGSSTVVDIPKDSTAFWTSDLSTAYFGGAVKRGVRLLNARRQVLLQDEINSQNAVQWRMHTNATVSIDEGGTSATLTLVGQTMKVSMVSPPSGAQFSTSDAVRLESDVTPPAPDQPNPGVKVLIISLPAGTYNLQVLFNPQWSGMEANSDGRHAEDSRRMPFLFHFDNFAKWVGLVTSAPRLFEHDHSHSFPPTHAQLNQQRRIPSHPECVLEALTVVCFSDCSVPLTMFIRKTQKVTLTLFVSIALVLALASSADAHVQHRDHVNLKRLIKKRAPAPQDPPLVPPLVPVAGAGAAVPSFSSLSSSSTTSVTSSTITPSQTTTSASTTSVSETASTTSETETTSATSTSTSSQSSTTSQTSETTTSETPPTETSKPAETTSERLNVTGAPETPTPSSKPTLTRTELVNSTESPSSIPLPQSGASKAKSTTLTVLIVVASSVAGVAILWTVFRKWKLGRSSKFDERLQPIDWQPTNPDDGAVPGNRRRLSGASSFHSASGHGTSARGYGASDHGHGSEVSPSSYAIPDHDFTAGPTTLAPVGGYADLARGPSPQPQMHQMSRGPSMNRPAYDVGVPLHHQAGYGTQDAYDYGGSRRY